MNFLKTVTDQMQAQVALQSIANAKAEQLWQEDFAKFCDKKKAFIADCIEAGLNVIYVEEDLSYPCPIPKSMSIMVKEEVLSKWLTIRVKAGWILPPGECTRTYGYEVSCTMIAEAYCHIATATPDAQSLHDALVSAAKSALAGSNKLVNLQENHATIQPRQSLN